MWSERHTPPCAGVDDERALYWGDRKPAGHGTIGLQFCRGCGKQFEGAITASSNLLSRRYPGKPAGRLCPCCDQLQRGELLAASDGVRDADPLEFAKAVGPVFALRPSLLLLIVDATDVEGTLIDEALRGVMPSDAPVLLAVTKADLLPRLQQQELAFVCDRARARGISVSAAYAVSAP